MKKLLTNTALIIILFQSIQTVENRRKKDVFPEAFAIIKTIAEVLFDKEGLLDEIPHLQPENLNETYQGWTPLSMALSRNFPLIANDLLNRGARLEIALKHAIDYDLVTALASLLPLTNSSVNDFVIDTQGNTLFTYALINKKKQSILYMYNQLNQKSIEPLKALHSMIFFNAKDIINKLYLRFPVQIGNNLVKLLINLFRNDTTNSQALFIPKITTALPPLLLIKALVFLNREYPNLLNQKNAMDLIHSLSLKTLTTLLDRTNQGILSTFLDLYLKNIPTAVPSLLDDLILLAQTAQEKQCSYFEKTCLFWIENYFLNPLVLRDDAATLPTMINQLRDKGLSLPLSNLYANALAVNAAQTALWLSKQPECSISLSLLLDAIEENNASLVQEHLRNFLEQLDVTILSEQDFMTLIFDLETTLKDTLNALEDPAAKQSWQTFYVEIIQPFLAQYIQKDS